MFAKDPFGYSTSGWHRLQIVRARIGYHVDLDREPTAKDLMEPLLWLSHAKALTESARVLLQGSPNGDVPEVLREIYSCQYYASVIMQISYSIEACLKALIVLRDGVDSFVRNEHAHKTHNLNKLSEHFTKTTKKEEAILRNLTHFSEWAGRYPNPGTAKIGKYSEINTLSTKHRITLEDLFALSAKTFQLVVDTLNAHQESQEQEGHQS